MRHTLRRVTDVAPVTRPRVSIWALSLLTVHIVVGAGLGVVTVHYEHLGRAAWQRVVGDRPLSDREVWYRENHLPGPPALWANSGFATVNFDEPLPSPVVRWDSGALSTGVTALFVVVLLTTCLFRPMHVVLHMLCGLVASFVFAHLYLLHAISKLEHGPHTWTTVGDIAEAIGPSYVCGAPLVILARLLAWPLLFRRATIKCIDCRYDLTGNTSGVCPECGLSFLNALSQLRVARGP